MAIKINGVALFAEDGNYSYKHNNTVSFVGSGKYIVSSFDEKNADGSVELSYSNLWIEKSKYNQIRRLLETPNQLVKFESEVYTGTCVIVEFEVQDNVKSLTRVYINKLSLKKATAFNLIDSLKSDFSLSQNKDSLLATLKTKFINTLQKNNYTNSIYNTAVSAGNLIGNNFKAIVDGKNNIQTTLNETSEGINEFVQSGTNAINDLNQLNVAITNFQSVLVNVFSAPNILFDRLSNVYSLFLDQFSNKGLLMNFLLNTAAVSESPDVLGTQYSEEIKGVIDVIQQTNSAIALYSAYQIASDIEYNTTDEVDLVSNQYSRILFNNTMNLNFDVISLLTQGLSQVQQDLSLLKAKLPTVISYYFPMEMSIYHVLYMINGNIDYVDLTLRLNKTKNVFFLRGNILVPTIPDVK